MSVDPLSDDASIANDEDLWRRIPPWHFVFDENAGRFRPSSAAFENDPNGAPMSVVLANLVRESNREPRHVLANHPNFALASLSVGFVRTLEQAVVRDPLPEEPAHALVVGEKPKSVCRKMAKASQWVIPPAGNTETQ